MGSVRGHRPVLRIVAIFSLDPEALKWAEQKLVENWGPVALRSEIWPFDQTKFYTKSMGSPLHKQLLAFERLFDPAELASSKHLSNQWEIDFSSTHSYEVERPLNIDPGYLTEAKLVLATTKDRDHRLYIGEGMYAEVTLFFQQNKWQCRPWTYPDYQTPEYHAYFDQCRDYLRNRYQHDPSTRAPEVP